VSVHWCEHEPQLRASVATRASTKTPARPFDVTPRPRSVHEQVGDRALAPAFAAYPEQPSQPEQAPNRPAAPSMPAAPTAHRQGVGKAGWARRKAMGAGPRAGLLSPSGRADVTMYPNARRSSWRNSAHMPRRADSSIGGAATPCTGGSSRWPGTHGRREHRSETPSIVSSSW
jgi:hypothetical protein